MNTMNMPGFTAEASLYKKQRFGVIKVVVSQDGRDIVQPAMKMACVILENLLINSVDNNFPDYYLYFLQGAKLGAGCGSGDY